MCRSTTKGIGIHMMHDGILEYCSSYIVIVMPVCRSTTLEKYCGGMCRQRMTPLEDSKNKWPSDMALLMSMYIATCAEFLIL